MCICSLLTDIFFIALATFRIHIILYRKPKKDLLEIKEIALKNGENKQFIAVLCKRSLILRVKTILLVKQIIPYIL